MKNLFIDSNIWLSLYHFTNDDLVQFQKLKSLLTNDICLLIPTQIKKEVIRNRDQKIKDMLSSFEKFELKFPTFAKSYEKYEDIYKKFSELKSIHSEWIKDIKKDIENESLPADDVIRDFFNITEELECDKEIMMLAEQRYKSGNPPGKDNKFGDAINWECLLKNIPHGQDIFIISADVDYTSVLDKNNFNFFLKKEWEMKKNAKVIFYKSLSAFLKDYFEDIKLKTEQEKDELIYALYASGNFATTHAIIQALSKYSDWTMAQKRDLIDALSTNSQVLWIIGDDDVHNFYSKLIEDMNPKNDLVVQLKRLLCNDEDIDDNDDDDDDLPF